MESSRVTCDVPIVPRFAHFKCLIASCPFHWWGTEFRRRRFWRELELFAIRFPKVTSAKHGCCRTEYFHLSILCTGNTYTYQFHPTFFPSQLGKRAFCHDMRKLEK